MVKINILECSSKGDRRFSAFYARIEIYDKWDSIENHYQQSKGFINPPLKVKGAKPDYLIIKNKKYDKKYLTAYYKLLWVKYLDNNKELVEYASQFYDFNDIFKGKSINCQADVIRQYIKQGRRSIFLEQDIKDFIKELKENS